MIGLGAYTIGLLRADSRGILLFFYVERSFQTKQLCPRQDQNSIRIPKLKYEAVNKSVKLEGPLIDKCLHVTVILGHFESKVFTPYQLMLGAPLKTK